MTDNYKLYLETWLEELIDNLGIKYELKSAILEYDFSTAHKFQTYQFYKNEFLEYKLWFSCLRTSEENETLNIYFHFINLKTGNCKELYKYSKIIENHSKNNDILDVVKSVMKSKFKVEKGWI